jgi:glycosyltransferase involved in cell wall biosynthesis
MDNSSVRVLMAVCNYFNPDNRVFRAANTLQEAGFTVIVLSYYTEGLSEEEKQGSGFTLKRIKIGQLPIPWNQVRNLISQQIWKKKVRSFAKEYKPKYVHCHDYNTLFLGKFCNKKFKTKVIYDNHEYFQDLKYLHRYPMVVRKWIAWYEKKALRLFVDEMIVVSPGIAEAYAPLVRKPLHIIRNITDQTEIIDRVVPIPDSTTTFLSLQKQLGRKLFLYLGTNTQKGRGMDFAFKLVSELPDNYGLVIFGAKNEAELSYLNKKALLEGIGERFGAFMSLPIHALFTLSLFFYMGLSLIEPIYFSYLHSLPNKLFEYFSMGLPVVSSEIPDQSRLILENNIGLIIPFDIPRAKEIILKSESRSFNPEIKSLFNWESEKMQLLSIYKLVQ